MNTLVADRVLTDSEVHRRVLEELRWDTLVDVTDVGVEVDRGVVTLTGTVGSYAEKSAALEAARRVRGVMDVANDTEVHVPTDKSKTDTEIAQAVRQALDWNALLPHSQIRSTVSRGWITLDGTVSTIWHRNEAERTVRDLAGVNGIVSRIVVSPNEADPWVVRRAIEDALERQAEREAQRIDVDLHNGTLTLTGRVGSWRERRAIVGAAAHAPGVKRLEDHLSVLPDP
jgi:osmotically-inducible protein OsmY